MLLTASDAVDALELPVRDLALRLLPPRDATMTVVVGIDEDSLRAKGPWPWERTVLAAIIWGTERTPAPRMPRTSEFSRERRRMATPETAAVRPAIAGATIRR